MVQHLLGGVQGGPRTTGQGTYQDLECVARERDLDVCIMLTLNRYVFKG